MRNILLRQFCVCIKTEIRDHGVGFFEFSKDEETRQQQLEALKKLRQQVMSSAGFCSFYFTALVEVS